MKRLPHLKWLVFKSYETHVFSVTLHDEES